MKRKPYKFLMSLVVTVFVIVFGSAGYSLFNGYGNDNTDAENVEDETLVAEQEEITSDDVIELPEDSTFEIHFFDVGEADSTLVECDNHYMLVDGGNPGDSQFMYAYLQQHGIEHLDYIVCTHAHEDHVGGLPGALNYATVDVAYAPVLEYDNRAFNSYVKYLNVQGKEITIPKAGESFELGSANIQIVGPIDLNNAGDDPNNSSIVLHITYGQTSFLITGDAEEKEENDILWAGYDIKSTVLRVGHHGSHTSTSALFYNAVSPDYCVISVGEDNSYGHPHEETLDLISSSGAQLFRTDINGDITCTSDGENVSFSTEK